MVTEQYTVFIGWWNVFTDEMFAMFGGEEDL
jgi:hypothetical protein